MGRRDGRPRDRSVERRQVGSAARDGGRLARPRTFAFTMPGRRIHVSRELLSRGLGELGLAFIIAHEMAHHDLGHLDVAGEWLEVDAGGDCSLAGLLVLDFIHRTGGPGLPRVARDPPRAGRAAHRVRRKRGARAQPGPGYPAATISSSARRAWTGSTLRR